MSLSVRTSREQELSGVKKDAAFAADQDGQLKLKAASVTIQADLASDLKAKEAFTRRVLAYDQAGLIEYAVHAQWVERLFRALQKKERVVGKISGRVQGRDCAHSGYGSAAGCSNSHVEHSPRCSLFSSTSGRHGTGLWSSKAVSGETLFST